MPTRIVFTSGAHIEVDTPILEVVALLETHGRAGRPLVSAVDSSMQLLVNLERIEYLEVVGETAERRGEGPGAVPDDAEAVSQEERADARPVDKPFWARRGSARRSLDLGRFSALPSARLPRTGGQRRDERTAPGGEPPSAALAGLLTPDS